jgi:hypothetical protein
MKYILSIDGGACKCIIALSFLKNLEKFLIEKYNNTIYEKFDTFAGTSAGAMLVTPIVYNKMNTTDLFNLFSYENLQQLFVKNWSFYIRPIYSGEEKSKLIKYFLNENTKISDTEKDCLITGYNINTSQPMFFKSYISKLRNLGHDIHVSEIYNDIPLHTAVDISSAVPSYFPSVQFKLENGNVYHGCDGGMFAINPTDCIYADSLKLYGKDSDIRILSIGLGSRSLMTSKGLFEETLNWGSLQWLCRGFVVDRITYSNIPIVDYRMEAFTNILNHKYLRVEPIVENYSNSFEVNSIDDYNKLVLLGNDLWDAYKERISNFFED